MIRKLIASAFIFIVFITSSITLSYANTTINKNQYQAQNIQTSKYYFEVLEPSRNITSTDKNILLSFRASQGTKVNIQVYHNVAAKDKEENYVLSYEPIDITVGAFQKGWASVNLKTGLNKILFTTKYRNEPEDSVERIINVMEVQEVKQLLQNIVSRFTLGIGKR